MSGLLAQVPEGDDLGSSEASGTVGTYRVGLNYTVRHNTELVTAHYFYVSQLKDIPLTGIVHGELVELRGTDGSIFQLQFFGNGSNGNQPLTFYNSVGLRGYWSLGEHQLPAEFIFKYGTENPGHRLYSQVTSVPDGAFESMVKATQKAILSGDRDAASRYIHFPLRINGTRHGFVIRNRADLEAHWTEVFTIDFLAKLRQDVPHEMFVHEGEAMLGDGELWFDDRGIVSINPLPGHEDF
jgi:hypothetical protein